ncbi:outer membrane beta-barrel family protein [Pedobacter hartonius]|uniref:Outer membrane receptor proteins, mostly Fe transport n=1 Tax=Pedobacter hartonius TaxID=425514 RepID=A0A1H3W5W0_9SPHI|nr:outer membrane beta-barrel family protein [Pedobacter hartonius]SDZ82475.1 Outer membrane receptor proteins, mostly Fe transport [Pedobacter hartonius]
MTCKSGVLTALVFFSLHAVHAQSPARMQNVKDTSVMSRDTSVLKQLQKPALNLKEVKIRKAKPLIEKKTDRIVFNAESSIAGTGADVLELIGKIPGLRVVNDMISIVGKGSVNVMVNDRLVQLSGDDLASYLKSIPSDQVSKVEIIANPPAKYDAQGNNGLLNIVLKKAVNDGLQGSVNFDYSLASYSTVAAGGNLNYRKDKLSLYTNFNLRKGYIAPKELTDVFYPGQTWSSLNQYRNFRTVPSGQLGLDYQLSKNTLVGASYNGGNTRFHSDENIRTTIMNSKFQKLDSTLVSDANAKIRSGFNAVNLFLKRVIDTSGKQVLINADWFKYHDDKERFFNNNTYLNDGSLADDSFAQYLSASQQHIDLYTLKADADLPYRFFRLSFGTKFSFIRNNSDVSFYKRLMEEYVSNQDQANVFDYTENTQALYINVNKTVKKWALQLGLRAEYTQTKGLSSDEDQTDRNWYLQLFPTAFLTYRLNELNTFALSYDRRINRPMYKKLNPFRWYSNQYAYAEGNPFLKPSYSNNLELSHTYAAVLTSSVSFGYTNSGYSDVNFTDGQSNIQVLKPVNFVTGYNYQFSNSISLNPVAWLQSNSQLNLFYNLSNSSLTETSASLKGIGAYFSTSNQFYFNQDKMLSGEIGFWYQSGGIDGLQKLESQYNLDVGLRKLVLNKQLQFAAGLTDVLKSNKYRYTSLVNQIEQSYTNYYDSRKLRISIRYNFGNDRAKATARKPGNDEEIRRNN